MADRPAQAAKRQHAGCRDSVAPRKRHHPRRACTLPAVCVYYLPRDLLNRFCCLLALNFNNVEADRHAGVRALIGRAGTSFIADSGHRRRRLHQLARDQRPAGPRRRGGRDRQPQQILRSPAQGRAAGNCWRSARASASSSPISAGSRRWKRAGLMIWQRIDRIVHLAAQAGVRHSIEHPQDYLQSNYAGHLNILELARRISNAEASGLCQLELGLWRLDRDPLRARQSGRSADLALCRDQARQRAVPASPMRGSTSIPRRACASSPSTVPGAGRTWPITASLDDAGGQADAGLWRRLAEPRLHLCGRYRRRRDRRTRPAAGSNTSPHRLFNLGNDKPNTLNRLDRAGRAGLRKTAGARREAGPAGRRARDLGRHFRNAPRPRFRAAHTAGRGDSRASWSGIRRSRRL